MKKEFWFYPDIICLSLLFIGSFFFFLTFATSWTQWLSILIGMVTYTLGEYLTHRFVFHMKPPKHPFFLKLMKRVHYDHHVKPKDLHLLFLPLWYSVPNIVVVAILVFFITGNLAVTSGFISGVVIFIIYYEYTHYVAHRPINPKTPWGKWMKKVHLWHHYKNEQYWYGVTSPIYDYALGTFKDQKDVEKSATARDLEKE
ncbi:sterol desaturase family protein [Mangrovibacillus cuniculi]|uniref:Fatty acid hydroxylase n=1 Tax=Mangrovibacillus cuniculi TaxID=2593652 RepID=A0A7S8HGI5_9BACI|nr:sterol desaturase family protein [Mangrovibacillus cuniculi]QPC47842.1 fatty acid hydroxylase [Mangrovibacillus cuniculi]